LDAFCGFSFFSDNTFKALNPSIPDFVIGASDPPVITIFISFV